jgi:hypothetical protein
MHALYLLKKGIKSRPKSQHQKGVFSKRSVTEGDSAKILPFGEG